MGASETIKVTAQSGFIDDVVAADNDRLAYVLSDAATKCELHVLSFGTKSEQVVDLSPVTLHPVALQLLGSRIFVVGRQEDGRQNAAVFELADKGKAKPAGSVVYKIPPAHHISVIARDGKQRVATHRATPSKGGTRHEIELLDLETGRRIGAVRSLELDSAETNKQLDFRVSYWTDGWTRANGIKGGEWDRKENQRSPDSEVTYDLPTAKFVEKRVIADLFEQRRRFQSLADAGVAGDFVHTGWDKNGIQVWKSSRPRTVELDQPFTNYDAKSLQGVVGADGSAWFVLKVDPVNPDAVARKKADLEYLDVFHASVEGRAQRRARILAAGTRHRFGVAGDRFWLMERNQGFERGAKSLTLYQFP